MGEKTQLWSSIHPQKITTDGLRKIYQLTLADDLEAAMDARLGEVTDEERQQVAGLHQAEAYHAMRAFAKEQGLGDLPYIEPDLYAGALKNANPALLKYLNMTFDETVPFYEHVVDIARKSKAKRKNRSEEIVPLENLMEHLGLELGLSLAKAFTESTGISPREADVQTGNAIMNLQIAEAHVAIATYARHKGLAPSQHITDAAMYRDALQEARPLLEQYLGLDAKKLDRRLEGIKVNLMRYQQKAQPVQGHAQGIV